MPHAHDLEIHWPVVLHLEYHHSAQAFEPEVKMKFTLWIWFVLADFKTEEKALVEKVKSEILILFRLIEKVLSTTEVNPGFSFQIPSSDLMGVPWPRLKVSETNTSLLK